MEGERGEGSRGRTGGGGGVGIEGRFGGDRGATEERRTASRGRAINELLRMILTKSVLNPVTGEGGEGGVETQGGVWGRRIG